MTTPNDTGDAVLAEFVKEFGRTLDLTRHEKPYGNVWFKHDHVQSIWHGYRAGAASRTRPDEPFIRFQLDKIITSEKTCWAMRCTLPDGSYVRIKWFDTEAEALAFIASCRPAATDGGELAAGKAEKMATALRWDARYTRGHVPVTMGNAADALESLSARNAELDRRVESLGDAIRLLSDQCGTYQVAIDAAEERGKRMEEAVATAYGYLWHVNNGLADLPISERPPSLTSEKAAMEARKLLRDLLTNGQRGFAINRVRATLALPEAAGREGRSHEG